MGRTTLSLTTEQITSLTLENFRTVTGHRFRMTQDQTKRQLSREQAFEEFLTTLRNQQVVNTSSPS